MGPTMSSGRLRFLKKAPATECGEVEYEVWRVSVTEPAVLLGTVERYAHATYRSLGRGSRIRGSLLGYHRRWRPLLPSDSVVDIWSRQVMDCGGAGGRLRLTRTLGPGVYSRAEAVALLVRWHDHPELRDAD